jgi:uncharacterized protein YkwD
MILPLALAGILILAVVTVIPSNNYAFARHHHHDNSFTLASPTSSQESNNTGSVQQQSNSTGNGQESSSTGNGPTPQESNNTGNVAATPQESNNTGSVQQQSNSTGNGQESGSTGNAAATPQENNNTDFVNSILAIHNRERAVVGVPPLVWSDSLAAGAKDWAEHLAQINQMVHSTDMSYGENLAGLTHGGDTTAPMVESWVAEKNNWHGGNLTEENFNQVGHYTQMVWRDAKQVGCGQATGSVNDYLVCRYSVSQSLGAPY